MFDRFLIIHWTFNLPGLEYTRVVIHQGYTSFCVNCILKILSILNVLSTDYSSGSAYTRALNMLGLYKAPKKMLDSKYSSGYEHATVLNMPGLGKVLNKTLHYRYLIGL